MSWLEAISRHVESTYPEEGCGVVFRKGDERRVVPVPNVYDTYHAKRPELYPRTNRTAYELDALQFLDLLQAAEAQGESLELIFHSHCDVGAYFSAEDVRAAAPGGTPQYPSVAYLVVDVQQGRATGSKIFVWEGGQFVEKPSL